MSGVACRCGRKQSGSEVQWRARDGHLSFVVAAPSRARRDNLPSAESKEANPRRRTVCWAGFRQPRGTQSARAVKSCEANRSLVRIQGGPVRWWSLFYTSSSRLDMSFCVRRATITSDELTICPSDSLTYLSGAFPNSRHRLRAAINRDALLALFPPCLKPRPFPESLREIPPYPSA